MKMKRGGLDFVCRISLLFCLSILLMNSSSAIVITPKQTSLDNYASSQEIIITFLNDEFEPIGFQPTSTYTSSYLQKYITIEPTKFLLEPGEQENVRLTTHFPQDFYPQNHELIMQAYTGAENNFVLSFRPHGDQLVALVLENFHSVEEELGKAVTMTVNLKNSGNTVLFVTPRIFIKKQGEMIKNTTYPQPMIVLPGEIIPLTLRQDNSNLEPGEYLAVVDALYKADGSTRVTSEELAVFTVFEEEVNAKKESSDLWSYIIFGAGVFLVLSLFIWFTPGINIFKKSSAPKKHESHTHLTKEKQEHVVVKKESFLGERNRELAIMSQECFHLHQDIDALKGQTHAFIGEVRNWQKQQNEQ
jgi:hypothetical protein